MKKIGISLFIGLLTSFAVAEESDSKEQLTLFEALELLIQESSKPADFQAQAKLLDQEENDGLAIETYAPDEEKKD